MSIQNTCIIFNYCFLLMWILTIFFAFTVLGIQTPWAWQAQVLLCTLSQGTAKFAYQTVLTGVMWISSPSVSSISLKWYFSEVIETNIRRVSPSATLKIGFSYMEYNGLCGTRKCSKSTGCSSYNMISQFIERFIQVSIYCNVPDMDEFCISNHLVIKWLIAKMFETCVADTKWPDT